MTPESPAAKAGIETGDVILKFNGHRITTSSSLPPYVGRTKIGESVPVVVMRNKKQKTLRVTIEKLEEDAAAMIKTDSKPGRLVDDRLAVEIAELTQQQREQYDVEKGGVIVVTVEQGAGAKAGLRRGDVVVSLNNLQITSAKQFLDIARDLPEDKAIPVLVQRQQGAIFLALKIEKE